MRILFDTNILVSNFLPNGGQCHEIIVDAIYRHELYCTAFIKKELENVFKRRFHYSDALVHDMLTFIDKFFTLGETAKKVEKICRDLNDDPILADAVLNKINILITGDKDLLVLEHYKNVRIVHPSHYWDL